MVAGRSRGPRSGVGVEHGDGRYVAGHSPAAVDADATAELHADAVGDRANTLAGVAASARYGRSPWLLEVNCLNLFVEDGRQRLLWFTPAIGTDSTDKLDLLTVIGTQEFAGRSA
ncbi:hypothetical protein GCM10027521_00540 [Amycolatopsis cihanbeyliensis]